MSTASGDRSNDALLSHKKRARKNWRSLFHKILEINRGKYGKL